MSRVLTKAEVILPLHWALMWRRRCLKFIWILKIYTVIMTKKNKACSVQPTEQVASPRANSPRRVLRSRQGNAGLIVNLGEGSTSFIVTRDRPSDFSITKCKDKRCHLYLVMVLGRIVRGKVVLTTHLKLLVKTFSNNLIIYFPTIFLFRSTK